MEIKDERSNWPQYKGGITIGMGGVPLYPPEGYEQRTNLKDLDQDSSIYLPDEVLGMGKGAGVHVVGRAPGKIAVSAGDHGDPVVLLNKAKILPYGFDESKYNWEPIDNS